MENANPQPGRENHPEIVLRGMVVHVHHLAHTTTVEEAHAAFHRLDVDFLGILEGDRFVGGCSRRELGQSLGSRFGFALNAHRPIHEYLMAHPLMVETCCEITEVFKAVAARGNREFYDDVILVDEHRRYQGMVPIQAIVRLQTEFLLGNIARVEESRREIAEKNQRMQEDLQMACEVQHAMLPRLGQAVTFGDAQLGFAQRYVPTDGLSGDFFDVLPLPDGRVGFLICDVMGHGVRSALVTAMVRALAEELHREAADPGEFLTRLNRGLHDILRRAGELIFVTAAYVVVDLDAGRLSYAQAGHPTPLLWNRREELLRPVRCDDEQAGPALGLTEDFVFQAAEEPFHDGDRVILFTDGVFEAASREGEEFGPLRMARALSQRIDEPIDAWLGGLLSEVLEFSHQHLSDDVCIVAAELCRVPVGVGP